MSVWFRVPLPLAWAQEQPPPPRPRPCRGRLLRLNSAWPRGGPRTRLSATRPEHPAHPTLAPNQGRRGWGWEERGRGVPTLWLGRGQPCSLHDTSGQAKQPESPRARPLVCRPGPAPASAPPFPQAPRQMKRVLGDLSLSRKNAGTHTGFVLSTQPDSGLRH